ncbi:MAG: ABC transporter ATP-binding protein [Propionibacteriaceae bacterium]|nr:ABC transporter ATP-binding protein [Propionibacteriaceae bacterium]
MSEPVAALALEGLTKRFPGFTLDQVTLTLPAGYVMGLVGQNGAGKTTIIRLILNMARRDAGRVTVLGLDNLQDELAVKQEIAVVFDQSVLVDSWRVRDVEPALAGFYARWDKAGFRACLDRFDLPGDRRVKELSRGMGLKLALAVALSHDARLLILDEPTSGLDPVARDELLGLLREYLQDGDRSVFFSTHITSDLDKIADHITVLHRGAVFYSGSKDGLLDAFVVARGPHQPPDRLRRHLIGPTQTSIGFSGLLPAARAPLLGPQMVADRPTIDDVLIHVAQADHGSGPR